MVNQDWKEEERRERRKKKMKSLNKADGVVKSHVLYLGFQYF